MTPGSSTFATTHWSVVLAARGGDSPASAEALERLCQTCWPPIHAYLRRTGHDADQAADLTEDSFAGNCSTKKWPIPWTTRRNSNRKSGTCSNCSAGNSRGPDAARPCRRCPAHLSHTFSFVQS